MARISFLVTITHGMSGYFAVLMGTDSTGFSEPYETGIGRYANREDAIREAREWAKACEFPLDPSLKEQS